MLMREMTRREIVSHAVSARQEYQIDNDEDFEEFAQMFQGIIGDDCYAVTVNNMVQFNLYEFPEDHSINVKGRRPLYENPRALLNYLFGIEQDARFVVYMFPYDANDVETETWSQVCTFDARTGIVSVKYHYTGFSYPPNF